MAYETTILLITYRRTASVRRLLAFWKRAGLDRPVMVLDSSPPEDQEKNRTVCEQAGLLAPVVHRGFPSDQHGFQKWDAVNAEITTPFLNFAADDDFLMPAALGPCEDFLRQNPDYAVCQGFHLAFLRHGDAIRIMEDSFTESNDAPTAEGRIWRQLNRYGHFTYGLRRTSAWRSWPEEVRRQTLALHPEAASMHEMLDGMLQLATGKVKRLPLLNSVRNGQPTFEDGWRRTFVFGPNFSGAMTSFRRTLIEALSLKAARPAGDYELLLDEGLSAYFGGVLGSTGKRKLLLETFPALNSPTDSRENLRVMVEEMQYRPEDFAAMLEEIIAHPLELDLAPMDVSVRHSGFRLVQNLDEQACALSSHSPGETSGTRRKHKLPKILRQPKKSFGSALMRIGERLGGGKRP